MPLAIKIKCIVSSIKVGILFDALSFSIVYMLFKLIQKQRNDSCLTFHYSAGKPVILATVYVTHLSKYTTVSINNVYAGVMFKSAVSQSGQPAVSFSFLFFLFSKCIHGPDNPALIRPFISA